MRGLNQIREASPLILSAWESRCHSRLSPRQSRPLAACHCHALQSEPPNRSISDTVFSVTVMQSSWPPVIKPYQMPTTQTRPTVNCTTGPGLGNTINTTCRQGAYQIQEAINERYYRSQAARPGGARHERPKRETRRNSERDRAAREGYRGDTEVLAPITWRGWPQQNDSAFHAPKLPQSQFCDF